MNKEVLVDGRVLNHPFITGVERYAIEIAKGLKNTFKERLDIAYPDTHNRYLQHLFEHIYLPEKASQYKVLFCPANVCPIIKPKGTKYVTTIHDLSFLYYKKSFSFPYRLYYTFTTPITIKNSGVIITVSYFEKNMIASRYPYAKGKIRVIYSGIDDVFFQEVEFKKEDYILYVGNLSIRKNFHGLLKAFERIYKTIDRKLVIVGMKPQIMNLDPQIKKILKRIPKEYVEFKGQINDKQKLAKIYKKASLFVFPSLYESFGFPPLEAMASGCPTVVSKVAALPEICGDAAYYVDPFNIDNIAQAIVKIVANEVLKRKLILKGKERASKFKWKKTIKEHKQVIKSLL